MLKCFQRFFRSKTPEIIIYAPCDGTIIETDKIHDPVFAENTIGTGLGIIPESDKFYAPAEGVMVTVFPGTFHAYGIKLADGTELLLHIGIDTVQLKGLGFKAFVEVGQHVTLSTQIATVDLKLLHKKQKPLDTPIIVTNETLRNRKVVPIIREGKVKAGQPIFRIVANT